MGCDKLEALIRMGPPPGRMVRYMVNIRFWGITHARAQGRSWGAITEALGLPASQSKNLAATFHRCARRAATTKDKPPIGEALLFNGQIGQRRHHD